MKLGRPTYSKENQVYVCECKDEEGIFRVESSLEGGKWTPGLDGHLEKTREQMISVILDGTKGWFSKPLTKDWLMPRLRYTIPTGGIPADFEGVCEWAVRKLHISKESFMCEYVLVDSKPITVELIELQENGELTQAEKKALVVRARRRAGMALLKAEQLMQDYAKEFGEDTEWEDEDEE